ncbi:GFA family protein [Budvicia diplopodorum]|uniref:GFA family protein n=1 Tax=Budvicia diplopodorum TaxID=1119056 RepID=UPI00135B0884|nr:GFA family protein [Budvicia diplopodorum]
MGKVTGKCLCGDVEFEATLEKYEVTACQCSMCRRWSGGIFLSLDAKNTLSIKNATGLKFYQSSDWGKRGFCHNCGTSLFWQTTGNEQAYVTYSSLELSDADKQRLKLTAEIFVDDQPEFYCFSNQTQRLTGEDVMKLLAEHTPG